jgi:hypothetical protein
MPEAPVQRDEAGEPIEDPGDAVVDIDPSADPTVETVQHEGMLLRGWMKRAVADDPTHRETFEILEEWANEEVEGDEDEAKRKASLRAIAAKHGLSEAAIYKRAARMNDKYLPRYRRWRNGMVMFLLLATAVIVALVARALPHARPPLPIQPEPSLHPVAPVPSVPVNLEPKDTEFMPALPTEPSKPTLGDGKPKLTPR